MAWRKTGWDGGRVWVSKDGTETYYVWTTRRGVAYKFSTGCTTEASAKSLYYRRFQPDPEGFVKEMKRGLGLRLDQALIDEYLDDLRRRNRSEGRIGKCRGYLGWWRERLTGDLRRVVRRDLDRALAGAPNPGGRIAIIKAFFGWLRRCGRLDENPAASLVPPPSKPAQWSRPRVIGPGRHAKALEKLEERYRDILILLSGTGWHVSEAERYAETRCPIEYKEQPDGTDLTVLVVQHKSGGLHRTIVSEAVAEAALRIRDAGPFNRVLFYRAVKKACVDAGVKPFTPGMYRATVATAAIEAGEDPVRVSQFLGHSYNTMRKFYATHAAPPKIRTMT